jgi:hypothetical protein
MYTVTAADLISIMETLIRAVLCYAIIGLLQCRWILDVTRKRGTTESWSYKPDCPGIDSR